MLLLDYKKGWQKKTYKTRVSGHPLLERRKRKKKREARGQKTPPFLHSFGALKTGRK